MTSDAASAKSWQTPVNMGPYAYGTVLADGTLKANSGNVTVIKGAV